MYLLNDVLARLNDCHGLLVDTMHEFLVVLNFGTQNITIDNSGHFVMKFYRKILKT